MPLCLFLNFLGTAQHDEGWYTERWVNILVFKNKQRIELVYGEGQAIRTVDIY